MPTESPPSSANLSEVRKQELVHIADRRKCHGYPEPAGESAGQDLVGLALSGGGVRSASFNLGVLQAFVHRGLLKYVDYLSTVSGGGYVGSFLASLPLKLEEKKRNEEMARHEGEIVRTLDTLPPQMKKEMERHAHRLSIIPVGGNSVNKFEAEMRRHAASIVAAYGNSDAVRTETKRHASVLTALRTRSEGRGEAVAEAVKTHREALAKMAPLRLQEETRRHAESVASPSSPQQAQEESWHAYRLASIYGDPEQIRHEMNQHEGNLAAPHQDRAEELQRHIGALAALCANESGASLLVELDRHGKNLADLRGQPLKADEVDAELARDLVPAHGQPERVVQMVREGKYLNRPDSFANFYFIGLLLNNLAIFSGLATLCMFLAYAWRLLDGNWLGGWIYLRLWPSRFWIELWRPFLPAVVFFALWLAAWVVAFTRGIAKRQRPRTRWTRFLLTCAGCTLLIGAAVVLATPVISIPDVGSDQSSSDQQPEDGVKEISGRQHVIATTIFGLILTALTPFLKFDWLLQSGIHPKTLWERQVFVIASLALLVGVPLILIWWFAHHDFAGLDKSTRDRQILMGDINYRRWPTFWERVKKERDASGSPGALIYEGLARSVPADLKELGLPPRTKISPGAIGLGEVPVPLEPEPRAQKQRIIDAINVRVIGVAMDAVTKKEIGDPDRRSDFAKAVCDFWCREQQAESNPVKRREAVAVRVHGHGEAHRILALFDRQEQSQITFEENKEFNRLILEASYPEEILPRLKIFRQNVIDADQKCRLIWLFGFGAVFLVAGCINTNATSLHSYYRDRLAATFIEPIENGCRTVRLADLDTTSHGTPYLLMAGTLNRKPRDRDPSMLHPVPPPPVTSPPNSPTAGGLGPEQPGETPTEVFLMSRLYCGSTSLDYRRTADYHDGRLELDDAMAISGAAFSPVQTSNPMIGFLMTIFNVRLGQWLPTPKRPPARWPRFQRWLPFSKPCFLVLLWDWLRDWITSPRPGWYFVTDGGHHENLGLWSLLERRCRLIIVSDASEDPRAGFADLLRVLRRARFEEGIDVVSFSDEFQEGNGKEGVASLLEQLGFPTLKAGTPATESAGRQETKSEPHPPRLSKRHFFLARIEYPEDTETKFNYLIYLKPSFTGDEPAELQGYASLNPDFPHHPTLDQLYDEDKFESYRQLGEHIGERLVDQLHLTGSAKLDIDDLIDEMYSDVMNEGGGPLRHHEKPKSTPGQPEVVNAGGEKESVMTGADKA